MSPASTLSAMARPPRMRLICTRTETAFVFLQDFKTRRSITTTSFDKKKKAIKMAVAISSLGRKEMLDRRSSFKVVVASTADWEEESEILLEEVD